MRGILICAWLLVPAVVLAYHYGPGKEKLAADDASYYLADARAKVAAGEWDKAVDAYSSALALLPADRVDATRRVRLERGKALLRSSQLASAFDELTLLMQELEQDKTASPALVADARQALANAQYYLTWVMRLEGQPRAEWEPVIEASRQNYRLLAEDAEAEGSEADTLRHEKDLESAIRLARLDPAQLQALPLPKECQGCKSGNCKCKGKKPGQKPGQKKSEDARGAGMGPPPDNQGS